MKLRGIIMSDLLPSSEVILVKFEKDSLQQKFEVICNFKPFTQRIRKYGICDFWIKWRSEEFINSEGKISYRTYLFCEKAVEVKEK